MGSTEAGRTKVRRRLRTTRDRTNARESSSFFFRRGLVCEGWRRRDQVSVPEKPFQRWGRANLSLLWLNTLGMLWDQRGLLRRTSPPSRRERIRSEQQTLFETPEAVFARARVASNLVWRREEAGRGNRSGFSCARKKQRARRWLFGFCFLCCC